MEVGKRTVMIVAGIDCGMYSVKVVLLGEGRVLGHSVARCGPRPSGTVAEEALRDVLAAAGISRNGVYCAVTGSGRTYVPFGDIGLAETWCLAKAASLLLPSAVVLDVGAEKVLVVKCSQGRALKTASHARCASGTGLFLEMVAEVLGVAVEGSGELALEATEDVEVLSTCTVFAESEVISLVHSGKKPPDILRGAFRALSSRIYPLLERVGCDRPVLMVGAVARNVGLVRALEEVIGQPVAVPSNPELFGAKGAAFLADERASG